jgi:histidinol-phosphate/aromatic aminotransferase/cobyric acid decarboxylase-like protein
MPVSRRGFLRIVGAGGGQPVSGALLAARGLEAHFAEAWAPDVPQTGRSGGQGGRANRPQLPPGVEEIRINSNENPLGPGKTALDAITGKYPEAGRYPFNSSPKDGDLVDTLAKKYQTKADNIVLGAG